MILKKLSAVPQTTTFRHRGKHYVVGAASLRDGGGNMGVTCIDTDANNAESFMSASTVVEELEIVYGRSGPQELVHDEPELAVVEEEPVVEETVVEETQPEPNVPWWKRREEDKDEDTHRTYRR